MTLEKCKEERGWEGKNRGVVEALEKMELRLRNRMPEGRFQLTKLQQLAIDTPAFWRDWSNDEPQNVIIQGATSAGKTLLAELAILDTLAERRRAIVLVPLKSMVNERKKQFFNDMDPYFRVYAASSDYMEYDERLIKGDYEVAVIVYEKFFAMLSQGNQQIMNNCGLLVVDEMAMLGKEQRGPKLELALEIVRRNHPDTRIMCLATSDCGSEKICRWLGIDEEHRIFSAARPVALEEHIVLLNGEGSCRTIPADCEELVKQDPPKPEEGHVSVPGYQRDWKIGEKKKHLLQAVINQLFTREVVPRVLVFVGSQAEASAIALFLKESMGDLFPRLDGRGRTAEYDHFCENIKSCEEDEGQINLIRNLIPHGIAYHHAGLSTTLRELIEEEFARSSSVLKVIVATETLTIGVNMPFDAMVMMSNRVPRGEGKPVRLTQQEYRNYIGRAGRLGQSNMTGISYLMLEEQRDFPYYWNSYGNCEEIESALVSAKEDDLASYYLSLLMDSKRDVFTTEDIKTLFEESLTHVCRENKKIDPEKLYDALYNAYMADECSKGGAKGKGRKKQNIVEYAIDKFGKHMAPYAFSMDTCIDIYEKFFDGKENNGLPWDIACPDIDNDRYLLDILYHICRHQEIEKSSVLSYPKDDHNPGRLRKARSCVTGQLKSILGETDPEGNKRYELWQSSRENDLYRFMTEVNLGNEDLIAEAAMRAVLLFYWTKGKSVSRIQKLTNFQSFTKVTGGDIERIAEVASFHLDAIYKCLSTSEIKNKDIIVDSFYMLQCRVKYGMSWDLVRLANKHVHGLDRNRLLRLEEAAGKMGMKPVDYLYCESAAVLEQYKYITRAQRNSLMEALERRGEANEFNSLMELASKDTGSKLSSMQKEGIERIYNFAGGEAIDLYEAVRDTVNDNELIPSKITTDGSAERLLWINEGERDIVIGALTDLNDESQVENLKEYFRKQREKGRQCILLAGKLGEIGDWHSSLGAAAQELECETVLDNEFFAMMIANTILKEFANGNPITSFLKDARGIFTMDEYKYYSPENYIQSAGAEKKPDFYFVYNKSRRAYTNQFINISDLKTQIGRELEFKTLAWGKDLEDMGEELSEVPVVLMLEREMITRSRSLHSFIHRLYQNNHFKNCLLMLSSEDAQKKWDYPGLTAVRTKGECQWSENFCGIEKIILHDTNSAAKAIIDYCGTWKPGQFTIGISYAHEDSFSEEERMQFHSDNMLLKQAADQLKLKYGEHQILFDQYEKANALFDQNRAREKSLEAYRTCKVFLILWNTYTRQSENCKKERDAIFERCERRDARYFYLTPTGAPAVPEEDFSLPLHENSVRSIVDKVEEVLKDIL